MKRQVKRDSANPTREGRRLVSDILKCYVAGMINDGDYARLEHELLDVMRSELRLARQLKGGVE